MLNLLTDVAGLAVGHATDMVLGSGVTAILFDKPASASVSILGGAPGLRDTALLEPGMTVEQVDAIVLSGGSAFGLDAAGGVQAALRALGRGRPVGAARVPIVPQAILFDLTNGGAKDWGRFSPYRDLGDQAARDAAPGLFALGSVGAGTGATTATVKGGLGSASVLTPSGHVVAALVAVNAIGSPIIGDGPWFWAAPFEQAGEFGGCGLPPGFAGHLALRLKGAAAPGTTIGIVATDAALTRAQAKRLAIAGQDGVARAVIPAHLPGDGDTIFAAGTGLRPLGEALVELCHAAAMVTARAIARGVYEASPLDLPGAQATWRQAFGHGAI